MILYKYLPPERIDVLRDGMIRFTQLAVVNDPFDCHPRRRQAKEFSSLPQAEHRCCLTAYVEGLQYAVLSHDRQTVGLLSLTEKTDNLLMWAHYAQNHEGFVIGFDTDHEFFSKSDDGTGLWKVRYSVKRPSLPKSIFEEGMKRQPEINPYGVLQAFIIRDNSFNPDSDPDDYRFVKGMEWEHEQEWRLLRNLKPPYHLLTISQFPIYLFPFPRTSVHSIIIGCRGFSNLYPEIRAIFDQEQGYSHLKLFTARTDHNEFRLVIEAFDSSQELYSISTSGTFHSEDEEFGYRSGRNGGDAKESIDTNNKELESNELQLTERDINSEKRINYVVEAIKEIDRKDKKKYPNELLDKLSAISSSNDCFDLFIQLFKEDRLDEAGQALERAIELCPNKSDGLCEAGSVMKEVGAYGDAKLAFEQVICEDPTHTVAHYNLGNLYVNLGKIWHAEAAFRTALICDPNFAQARVNVGMLYQKQERLAEAEACYEQAIKDNPKLMEARWNLVNILISSDRFEEALHQLHETLLIRELEEKLFAAFLGVNMLKMVHENIEHKEQIISTMLNVCEDQEFIQKIIFALRLSGFDNYAIHFIEKLSQMLPLDPKPFIDLAGVYKKLGNVALSNQFLEKARFFVKPQEFDILTCLASISEEIDQAFEYLQKENSKNQLDESWLNYDPNLEWIRNDPRFHKLVQQLESSRNRIIDSFKDGDHD